MNHKNYPVAKEYPVGRGKLGLHVGDITMVRADAIVNAANSELRGGGGVDGAIHRAGGPSIMAELAEIRRRMVGCPPGDAVCTGAGNLPAQWVFHAVGPVYRGGTHGEEALLRRCYRRCIELAHERGARTITFPAISTGVYSYPVNAAAEVAVRAVADSLRWGNTGVAAATFVLFDHGTYQAFERAADRIVPEIV